MTYQQKKNLYLLQTNLTWEFQRKISPIFIQQNRKPRIFSETNDSPRIQTRCLSASAQRSTGYRDLGAKQTDSPVGYGSDLRLRDEST